MYPLNSGVTGVVVTRKGSNASTTSASSSRQRPASVVIHDNDELLRLADELHSQEMGLEGERPKSSSASNLVRRNSSGYSSSGSRDRLSKLAKSQGTSKWPAKGCPSPPATTNGPTRPPQSPIRSRSYKGATSTVLSRVRAAESNSDPRRSSMCNLRPSGGKKGQQAEVKGQEKVMRRQKSHESSEAKRAAFLQNRGPIQLENILAQNPG